MLLIYEGILTPTQLDERRVLEAAAGLAEGAGGDAGLVQPAEPLVERQLQRLDALAQHQQQHHGEQQAARAREMRRLLAVAGLEGVFMDQGLAGGQGFFFIIVLSSRFCKASGGLHLDRPPRRWQAPHEA
jgi:hypothetical protein